MITAAEIGGTELRAAPEGRLTGKPKSEEAIAICRQMAVELLPPRKHGPTAAQENAMGALIADLLARDPADKGGWIYHSTSPRSFTGKRIGHRVFLIALEALRPDWIDFIKGRTQFLEPGFAAQTGISQADWATRLRATDKLRERFAVQGIDHTSWDEHFETIKEELPPAPSVELRAPKTGAQSMTARTRVIKLPSDDPGYSRNLQRMDRLNAFLGEQAFEPYGPVTLRRVFNNGTLAGYGWDQGGRLQAQGDSYQLAKKTLRREIRINGQPVLEIDVRASHVSLMVGMGLLPASVIAGDPYDIPDVHREVVKKWITMTIGNGRRHRRWPDEAKEDLAKKGIDTQDYPLRATGDAILRKLPITNIVGEVLTDWATLQYKESESLLYAVETLAYDHGVASLPVHDSLIVPWSKRELAMEALREGYRTYGGIEPTFDEVVLPDIIQQALDL